MQTMLAESKAKIAAATEANERALAAQARSPGMFYDERQEKHLQHIIRHSIGQALEEQLKAALEPVIEELKRGDGASVVEHPVKRRRA